MNGEAGQDPRDTRQPSVADALLAEQLRTHLANVPWAISGSALTAAFFTAMLWEVVPRTALLSWLGLLCGVLCTRVATGYFHRRVNPGRVSNRAMLMCYRAGFLLHGIAWGLASLIPVITGDPVHRAVAIIVLASLAASTFTMTVFDLGSALCFGVPTLGILSAHLLAQPDSLFRWLGVAAIGALAFLSLTARRVHQVVRNYVALRLTESIQAEALRASEELLDRTGATAGVGGWELELSTMVLRLTAQAYRIHDAPPASRPTFEGFVGLYAPEEQAAIRAGLADVIANGTSYDQALRLTTMRGRQCWVRLIGRPQFDGGRVVRINGVVQDVSDTKAAELALAEKHHLLTLLVQTTSEGFWFVDVDGVTTDVNPAMCAILGRAREDIIGKSIFTFVDAANEAIFLHEIERRRHGMGAGYEIALTRPDGTLIDCFNTATPIFDTTGLHIGSVGMWTDISAIKRTEQQLRATSEELAQKTQQLQVMLDSITQGIISMAPDGRLLVANRRVRELLDLPDTVLYPGANYDDVVNVQKQRGDIEANGGFVDANGRHRYFAGGRHHSPDVYVRRNRAGALIEVRTRKLPDGGIVRTYADVTAYVEAQRALSESEAELRALLDAFPGFIAAIEPDFVYGFANDRFAALVGRPREAIIGHSLSEVLGEARSQEIRDYAARVRPGEPLTTESDYAATAERPRIFLQVTHAIGAADDRGRHKLYAFGIDITARKIAEMALTAARDEAERANLAKSRFLSSMSHELRTPMNAILGFGQLLMSDSLNPLTPTQHEHVHEILSGASHLLELINEVLDLAQVETGKLQVTVERIPIRELLVECIGLLTPLAANSGVDVILGKVPECAGLVLADRMRLKQVLLNLLSNAIKYNRAGGQVHITGADDDGLLRLEIADTGHGFSAEQGERLFMAFERLGATHSAVEGAGLGLALSKRLMEAMGGEIGARSEPGHGSVFWLRLPRAPLPQTAQADDRQPVPHNALPADVRPRKVLYIEDNPVNVLLMEAMLARLPGLQLLIASLPEPGLQLAMDERPDLILLDIQLPGMDGFEVLRRLRQVVATREIPVIAVSASAMPDDLERGRAAGFANYLTKPLDMRQLLRAVAAALGQE